RGRRRRRCARRLAAAAAGGAQPCPPPEGGFHQYCGRREGGSDGVRRRRDGGLGRGAIRRVPLATEGGRRHDLVRCLGGGRCSSPPSPREQRNNEDHVALGDPELSVWNS
ncbi:unnamed protein product, partial [Ectocarpus sp. 12 AP-2014]